MWGAQSRRASLTQVPAPSKALWPLTQMLCQQLPVAGQSTSVYPDLLHLSHNNYMPCQKRSTLSGQAGAVCLFWRFWCSRALGPPKPGASLTRPDHTNFTMAFSRSRSTSSALDEKEHALDEFKNDQGMDVPPGPKASSPRPVPARRVRAAPAALVGPPIFGTDGEPKTSMLRGKPRQ